MRYVLKFSVNLLYIYISFKRRIFIINLKWISFDCFRITAASIREIAESVLKVLGRKLNKDVFS